MLTHLEEKEHRGVLTGSALTDVKITLKSGRAHQKHTEGGGFPTGHLPRGTAGPAESAWWLLEPYYEFRMELPMENVGRAMTDIQRMYGSFSIRDGRRYGGSDRDGPVSEMRGIIRRSSRRTPAASDVCPVR